MEHPAGAFVFRTLGQQEVELTNGQRVRVTSVAGNSKTGTIELRNEKAYLSTSSSNLCLAEDRVRFMEILN